MGPRGKESAGTGRVPVAAPAIVCTDVSKLEPLPDIHLLDAEREPGNTPRLHLRKRGRLRPPATRPRPGQRRTVQLRFQAGSALM